MTANVEFQEQRLKYGLHKQKMIFYITIIWSTIYYLVREEYIFKEMLKKSKFHWNSFLAFNYDNALFRRLMTHFKRFSVFYSLSENQPNYNLTRLTHYCRILDFFMHVYSHHPTVLYTKEKPFILHPKFFWVVFIQSLPILLSFFFFIFFQPIFPTTT